MNIQKPNWTPLELFEKQNRNRELMHETDSHQPDCDCNLCIEYFGLSELLQTFTEDEHAGAVIEANKRAETESYLQYLREQRIICWSQTALANIDREIKEYEEILQDQINNWRKE